MPQKHLFGLTARHTKIQKLKSAPIESKSKFMASAFPRFEFPFVMGSDWEKSCSQTFFLGNAL